MPAPLAVKPVAYRSRSQPSAAHSPLPIRMSGQPRLRRGAGDSAGAAADPVATVEFAPNMIMVLSHESCSGLAWSTVGDGVDGGGESLWRA